MSRRLALLALFVAALALSDRLREAARAEAPSPVDAVLEPPALPGQAVHLLSLGFESLAADASYLGAIQIFGDPLYSAARRPERLRRSLALARLLEYTTDLDPDFAYAYVFGAVAIPVDEGGEKLGNTAEAIALLRKGVTAVPGDWRIPFHLGYLLANGPGDFPAAAEAMAEAARRPKSPAYLPFLATRLAAHGGALDTGLALAKAMRETAETDEQRAEFDERIRLLVMEQHLRAIEAAADRYREREGHYPPDLDALAARDLPAVPEEPHGGSYRFDPLTGQASSTAAARLRLFDTDRRNRDRAAATPRGPTP